MDQGESGSNRRSVEFLDFEYGTTLVRLERDLSNQVWHIHHYGVTVYYMTENNRVTVTLYGEDIQLRERGILSKPPLSEIERIIIEESRSPKYAKIEKDSCKTVRVANS